MRPYYAVPHDNPLKRPELQFVGFWASDLVALRQVLDTRAITMAQAIKELARDEEREWREHFGILTEIWT